MHSKAAVRYVGILVASVLIATVFIMLVEMTGMDRGRARGVATP